MGARFRSLLVPALVTLVTLGWPLETAAAVQWERPATATTPAQCIYGDRYPDGSCPPPPAGTVSRTAPQSAPPETPTQPPGHDDDDDDINPGLVALGVLVAGALVACAAGACSKTPDASKLLKKGPQRVHPLPPDTFQTYGFIRDGWPVVVQYSSPSPAQLTITIDKKEVLSQTLPAGDQQVAAFRFNSGGAAKPKVALFSLRSGDGSAPDQILVVYAIGAGESAVGAITVAGGFGPVACQAGASPTSIRLVKFGPSQLHTAQGAASYSFVRDKALYSVTADILLYTTKQVTKDNRKVTVIETKRVWRVPNPPLSQDGLAGPLSWDGRDSKSKAVSTGLHALQVRGWQVQGDPDWITVISPDFVTVVD